MGSSLAQSDRVGSFNKTLIRNMDGLSLVGRNVAGTGDGGAIKTSTYTFNALAKATSGAWLAYLTVPQGGAANSLLKKTSSADYDWGWSTAAFLELSDTPSSFSGQANKILAVSTSANAVVFTALTAFASSPTAKVGTSTITGSATTFMRSDAAPSIDQAIAPTWTGDHSFTGSTVTFNTTNALNLMVGQIAFPATQNASSDANTLDDYEEGTFTPVFTATTPPSSVTYDVQTGTYTKIGNMVYAEIHVNLTSKGSGGAGTVYFTGYPFTFTEFSVGSPYASRFSFSAGYSSAGPVAISTDTKVQLTQFGSNVVASGVPWSNINNNSVFGFGLTYRV